MKSILCKLPNELHTLLKIRAATENKTMREILIEATTLYLEGKRS